MSSYGRLVNRIQHLIWKGVDWLFPPLCAGCGKPNTRWCRGCHRNMKVIAFKICPICGQPQENNNVCPRCVATKPHFSTLRSWALYEGEVRQAMHHLKYQRDLGLGEIFSQYLVRLYCHNNWNVDWVVPVPLARHRLAERGYNQASLLARPFAIQMNLPYLTGALTRTRETRSQVGLSASERRVNVDGAFSAERSFVKGKRVLVVDDVSTTGSTMDACASALLEAGANAVFCMSFLRASQRTEIHTN